ncbi:hypothetical protein M3Y99_00384800 [Aphelenchoides fujianensis]|nr:hypothetical protein M3Y99_00384800 [Aphelenchoides fujianensis]
MKESSSESDFELCPSEDKCKSRTAIVHEKTEKTVKILLHVVEYVAAVGRSNGRISRIVNVPVGSTVRAAVQQLKTEAEELRTADFQIESVIDQRTNEKIGAEMEVEKGGNYRLFQITLLVNGCYTGVLVRPDKTESSLLETIKKLSMLHEHELLDLQQLLRFDPEFNDFVECTDDQPLRPNGRYWIRTHLYEKNREKAWFEGGERWAYTTPLDQRNGLIRRLWGHVCLMKEFGLAAGITVGMFALVPLLLLLGHSASLVVVSGRVVWGFIK